MGIIKDPTSWRAGFEMGLAGFSFPYSKPRRKPTAYLYNGIRLPALAGKAIPFVKEYPQPDDPFPIEWNNMAIKNNTSIEQEGTSVFKISDSIPTSDELTNCIIVGSNSEMGSLTFAFNSVENIGSIDVFLYTYKYAAETIPVWILRVSENTDGYEPGLYFLDVFEDISVDYAMHYITFCLYNGVKMPDIETVWVDKQKYPYAFMEAEVSDNGAIARLYLTANPVQINASELSGLRIPAGGWVQYVCTTDPNIVISVVGYNHWKDNMMTGENDTSFDAPEETGIAWANYDVFNTDGTLYLAASEPIPVGTAPALDPLSLFLGWKAGNLVARQRGKKVEEEKTPVAYLYNGVRLPDINAVWTDKETYPYAAVVLPVPQGYQDLYALFIAGDIPTTVHNDTFGSTLVLEVGTEVKTYILATTQEAANIWGISEANVWIWNEDFTTKEGGEYLYIIDKVTWASHDVLNEDGTIYLAASEPVPVYE